MANASEGRKVVRPPVRTIAPTPVRCWSRWKSDRVVNVRGNPDHPFTDGRLCVKVNHYEERVHHAERVLYPLKRSGPKGSGQFTRITWAAAMDEIASRWKQIIQQHGPTAILPYSYLGTEGILNGMNVGDPFFNKLGATITERTFCDSGCVHRLHDDGRPHAGHRSRKLRALALHHPVGVQHHQHQHAPLAVHRRGAEARREDRRGRPGAHPHCARRPTGTFQSSRAPTGRWRWR